MTEYKIVREGMEGKHFWTIVEGCRSGKFYYVSTALLPFSDEEVYETMVFPCNKNGIVSKWDELSCDRTSDFDECVANHAKCINGVF